MTLDKDEKIKIFIVTAIILIFFSFMGIKPYFEMKAFNKFSDQKATYWDAMFTELRVIPQKND